MLKIAEKNRKLKFFVKFCITKKLRNIILQAEQKRENVFYRLKGLKFDGLSALSVLLPQKSADLSN